MSKPNRTWTPNPEANCRCGNPDACACGAEGGAQTATEATGHAETSAGAEGGRGDLRAARFPMINVDNTWLNRLASARLSGFRNGRSDLAGQIEPVFRATHERAEKAEAERDQLKAAIARVRELHPKVLIERVAYCPICRGSRWPCPTIAALDQPASPT